MIDRNIWFVNGEFKSECKETNGLVENGSLKIAMHEKNKEILRDIKKGDQVILKKNYDKSSALPFETNGKPVSVMEIKGIGQVKNNEIHRGKIYVEWRKVKKEWYFFTLLQSVKKIQNEEENKAYQELLNFVFKDKPQDLSWFFKHPYWKSHLSFGKEYAYINEITEVLNILKGEATLLEIQELIKKRQIVVKSNENKNWIAEIYRILQNFSSDSKSFAQGEDLFYRKSFQNNIWGLRNQNEKNSETYSSKAFFEEHVVDIKKYEAMMTALKKGKNMMLRGVCIDYKDLLFSYIGEKDEKRVLCVVLEKEYGFKKREKNGGLKEKLLENPEFIELCNYAVKDEIGRYFYLIKGINYRNISKVLGELFFLFRKKESWIYEGLEEKAIEKEFFIPKNIQMIGVMNDEKEKNSFIDGHLKRHFKILDL